MRKTILCYGDSNTWGYNPATRERYPEEVRWPVVLARELGQDYQVIAEGLNGRTTVWEDPIEEGRCGKAYLFPCLNSHKPLDYVVLLLGTNDLKQRFSVPPSDIARGAGLLVQMIRKSDAGPGGSAPEVLLLAPPPLACLSDYSEMFAGGAEKSHRLAAYYREQAAFYGCRFLDTSEVIVSSEVDGIHLDPGEHAKLGRAVARLIRQTTS